MKVAEHYENMGRALNYVIDWRLGESYLHNPFVRKATNNNGLLLPVMIYIMIMSHSQCKEKKDKIRTRV
jgi:hypothetical protein